MKGEELEDLKLEIKRFLLRRGVDLFGVADVSDLYKDFKRAVVFAVSQEKLNALASAHRTTVIAFTSNFIDRIAVLLMDLLERRGYKTAALLFGDEMVPLHLVTDRSRYVKRYMLKINHVELAVRAGLGIKGKNNLLVTPQYGPRVVLMSVLTNAELPADKPITSFNPCKRCNKCIEVCPYRSEFDRGKPLNIDCMKCRMCVDICPVGK
ncbi:MAG TPA: epoxyqueuosine reductase [Candidatus Korarchaeota archaeon]|nr:epoxyqueuosine reductase [Candidatus Korarchaeota archaeon]